MQKFPARVFSIATLLLTLVVGAQALTEQQRQSPAVEARPAVSDDSVKFLVIGDSGTGDRQQLETAQTMWRAREIFRYEFAIMLGDNLYGSERPQDYARKFEQPFKPLLDANIEFYASLGNHDDPNQMYYKPFGMGGKRYYTFNKKDVQFFVLDSNYMDRDQQRWLEQELSQSKAKWKVAYFHHPIYSSGGRHGSELDLRAIVEPLFIKYALNVVIAGHEHFYERLKPQKGIHYFTAGGAAKLRRGDIRVGPMTAKGFDTDRSFMMAEIDGDTFYFQALSRPGKLIDSGSFTRQNAGGTS